MNPLSQLRDIHLPMPVAWWPLAPGWYVVLALLLILLLGCGYAYFRKYKRRCWQRSIFAELARIQSHYQQTVDGRKSIAALSVFLRRAALLKYPRQQIAGLHGQAWLEFLNETTATTVFTVGPGKLLLTAPYQAQVEENLTELLQIVAQWLKKITQ